MFWLFRHFTLGHMRTFALRAAVQVIAITVGVALGYAVHLINASALAEFSAAIRQTSGDADAAIVGPREGFDEAVFDRISGDPSVVHASPVVTVTAVLAEPTRLRGQTLIIVGVDPLRAAWFGPQWIGAPDSSTKSRFALLDDGLYLSPAALEALRLAPGDRVGVQLSGRMQQLTIIGRLPAARAGLAVGAIDIGFAQWRLDALGRLTRIDLRLAPGTDSTAAGARWQLPAGVMVEPADAAAARVSNLSRAYRVNLNVLALVALFTGSFLVYSLQAQSVLARRPQLAFLRMAGATRSQVVALLMIEASIVGAIGSVLGIAAGAGIAFGALQLLGGDLGGGYFTSTRPPLLLAPETALAFAALGVLAALAGGWRPALRAANDAPATALKSGSGLDAESADPANGARRWTSMGLIMLAAATALLALPPLHGIPVAAYAAIGLVLIAAIVLKPAVAPWVVRPLARWIDARPVNASTAPAAAAHVPAWLALLRLAATPRFAAIGAAGIVASFALMVAMATMVASFRTSVDQWLDRVLPAHLYARAAAAQGSSARFSAADVLRMQTHPGVARAEFSRTVRLALDPQRAAVVLIIRGLPAPRDVPRVLPLVGDAVLTGATQPNVWVSEAFASLYGAAPGVMLQLPIGGRATPVHVAGVWRDYSRQSGAIIIDAPSYDALTAGTIESALPTDAALWLAPGAKATGVMRDLRASLDTRTAEMAEPGEIRALSLRIFDRSFAVTYVLELAAIAIGLTGIAATFSAQAIVRRREFGMLRHLGVTRAQILALLALEGLLVTALALLVGLVAGLAVAWVLVDFVNPQSFHWTMEFRVPLQLVAALIAALLFAAAVTALIAGRRAVAGEAILAVREDW